MIDLTPWEDNEKSNISSATSYSNSNTILSEMNEIPLIIEIESYANVLRQPVATVKKARVFTKDDQQNVLDDSRLDFTKNITVVTAIQTIKFIGLVTLIFQICLKPLRKMIRR